MNVKDYKCAICHTVGNWENVDLIASHKKNGMHICKSCGFTTYPSLYKSEEEIKEYYRKDYRPGPNIGNLFTGQRKIHYHEYFLRSLFDEWTKEEKKPVVGEMGAAYGLVLAWMRGLFDGDYYGSEMTLSYRRVAWHENKVQLDEELDLKNRKYDLLMSYKVHEHLMDPDIKLRDMALSLKDDGYLYISVPCWFDEAYNFGTTGFTLDYYYDTNHINVWSRRLFETLLKKSGLEIVKENHCIYDSTYLCKRNDEMMKHDPVYEDYQDIKIKMEKIKKASIYYDMRDYKKAVDEWPNYPTAWQAYYESTRAQWHQKGYEKIKEEFVKVMLDSCPNSATVRGIAGDIAQRYNNWDDAIMYYKKVLEMRPQNPEALMNLSHCFRHLARLDKSKEIEMLNQAKELVNYLKDVSLQSRDEAINWIYHDAAKIPLPNEQRGL